MLRFFLTCTSLFFLTRATFAISETDIGFDTTNSNGSIINIAMTHSGGASGFVSMLSLIQSLLLKVVLPIVVIGASLYIAYELFTAEGDESKMKKAQKSIAYTAIALIAIALSYGLVSIVSRLSF